MMKLKVDERGRIVIPKIIRENFNIESGKNINIDIKKDTIIIYKNKKVIKGESKNANEE